MRFDVHYAIAGLVIYILVLFSLCVQYDNKQNSVIKLRQLIECLFMADLFDNINLGVVIVYGITCVTTFCTKLVFYFDGTAFRKGPLYNVAYILGIYFMLYSFVRLMQYKSSFSKRRP